MAGAIQLGGDGCSAGRHVPRTWLRVVGRPAPAEHFVTALRYVSLNPVRARLVDRPEDWQWSSVRAHLARQDDPVVRVAPALERVGDFAAFLGEEFDEALTYAALRKAESVGRPVGSREWLADMEARTGRTLAPGKRGPKPRASATSTAGSCPSG